ncbi:hypothetical protein [Calycomorphotria hydatis]|uniref:Uncharacterized protein n=1 Tax=Calycomorphotria hydatis TaxID=2528027 RepID=A0A517TB34_9PLAN|nr:hypothetical protein [Calycomorphotria hydatis]QDT65575.1 hypothetical protein V22_28300 [Calycomorphotria hydatis]
MTQPPENSFLEVVEEGEPWVPSTMSLIAVGVALTVVATGLFLTAPGVGVLFLILCVAPLARTVAVVNKRAQYGKETSTGSMLGMFLLSSLMTMAIVWMLCAAGCAAFLVACFGACFLLAASSGVGGAPSGSMETAFTAIISVAVLISLGVTGWLCWKLSAARYKKDIES